MKTYAIGDRIKLDSGETVQVTAMQPCSAYDEARIRATA